MAYLKPDDVRKMNGDERAKSLYELRKELVHERGVAAMGGSPPSPGKIRQIRRQIARILTIQQEERLGIRDQTEKKLSAKPKAATPIPVPTKGQPALAARKAHAYRMNKQAREDAVEAANAPQPAPKQAKPKSTQRPAKKSEAKKPAAPDKAAANKAAKAAGSKTKKEETRRNG